MTTSTMRDATTRRTFILKVASTGLLVAASSQASAQAMLSETDPQAANLGYKADGSKVDKAKFPKYAAGRACSNCALYQGAPNSNAGACPLFAGKQVAAKGWCNAWAQKG